MGLVVSLFFFYLLPLFFTMGSLLEYDFFVQFPFLFRYILNCLITQKKAQVRVGPLKNVKNQPKITVKSSSFFEKVY